MERSKKAYFELEGWQHLHLCWSHLPYVSFFFPPTLSFLRVTSRQETSLPLLDPRSACVCISSSWLFPPKHLNAAFWPQCVLEVVEIFIIRATCPSAKKQVSLFLRKVNMSEEKIFSCFGKQNGTLKTISYTTFKLYSMYPVK